MVLDYVAPRGVTRLVKHLTHGEREQCLGQFRTIAGEAEMWAMTNSPKLVDDPYCLVTYVKAHLGTWSLPQLQKALDASLGARAVRDGAKRRVLVVTALASLGIAFVAVATKPYLPQTGFLATLVGLGFVALGAGREIVRTLGYDLENERLKQWQSLTTEIQKAIVSKSQS